MQGAVPPSVSSSPLSSQVVVAQPPGSPASPEGASGHTALYRDPSAHYTSEDSYGPPSPERPNDRKTSNDDNSSGSRISLLQRRASASISEGMPASKGAEAAVPGAGNCANTHPSIFDSNGNGNDHPAGAASASPLAITAAGKQHGTGTAGEANTTTTTKPHHPQPLHGHEEEEQGGEEVDSTSGTTTTTAFLPQVFLLRHRMGYSTVTLSSKQRATFTRADLEDFLLYKEQKYNAVNSLGRFSVLLLLISTFAVFCLVFSACSTDWHTVAYDGFYQGMGLFVACRQWDRLLVQCTHPTSVLFSRSVVDPVAAASTGAAVVCYVSRAWARGYVAGLWTVGILHLLGQLAALGLIVHISLRPTRTASLLWVVWILLVCLLLGVINCVLFPFYVRCDRRACQGRGGGGGGGNDDGRLCSEGFGWGYSLYIAATALHALCFLFAFAMDHHIRRIRADAKVLLRQERRRKVVEEAAEEFVKQIILDNSSSSGGTAGRITANNTNASNSNNYESLNNTLATLNMGATYQHHLGSILQGGLGASRRVSPSQSPHHHTMAMTTTPRLLPAGPGLATVDISRAGDPNKRRATEFGRGGYALQQTVVRQRRGRPRPPHPSPLQQQQRGSSCSPGLDYGGGGGVGSSSSSGLRGLRVILSPGSGASGGSHIYASEVAPTPPSHTQPSAARSPRPRSAANTRRPSTCDTSGVGGGVGVQPRGPHPSLPSPFSAEEELPHQHKQPQQPTPEPKVYSTTRKQRQRLRCVMYDHDGAVEGDDDYLTAAELGVPIAGASDWVYDDKSDMYYSFERNLFWDSLTGEYFNCGMRTWQETPDSIVDVRDAMEFAWEVAGHEEGIDDSDARDEGEGSGDDVAARDAGISGDGDETGVEL